MTPEALGALLREAKTIAVVGLSPKPWRPSHQVARYLQRAGYRIDKIVYESRPGFFVVANVYTPEGDGPFPGVLFQLGHSRNGKAYDSYQRCCQGLVKLGYVVLAFDPMGQGERAYYPARDGMTRLSSPDEEHSRPGRQMLLVGDSMTRFQLGSKLFGTCPRLLADCARARADGLAPSKADEPHPVSYLSARWTLSSTASGQDVPGQKGDDDDRRRDRDDGDGGGGYYHAAILASCPASKPGDERRRARREKLEAARDRARRLEGGLGTLTVLCDPAQGDCRSRRRPFLVAVSAASTTANWCGSSSTRRGRR